jgi:phosphomannomutase/phosphoglucomutase
MATINPLIFREYDIRGVVDRDLNEEVLRRLGKAYGTIIVRSGRRKAALGRDCRLSSPLFARAFIEGMLSTGIDVCDIGMVTTPMLYFSLYNLDVEGGAMITASHNPPEYNGVKMCIGTDALYGEEILLMRDIAESGDFERGEGRYRESSVLEEYVAYLKGNLAIEPGLKVAVDCGNATTGIVAPRVFNEFGCELTELYVTPDGTFPNHHPDPGNEENLRDLIRAVKEKGLDVGIGFDGDGDRLGVVDERGRIVWGDMLVLIFAREILKEAPGATIIGDVKCSTTLYREIEKAGGKPIMWKTGHSLIKQKLKAEGAALAGELSGHIFFKHRFYGFDDALYAALRLLEIMSKRGKKVSELLEGVPQMYSTPEIRIDCPEEIKFEIAERVKNELKNEYRVNDIDGVRVEFPDGWGLVRASNTQPALVLRFEAETKERLAEIRKIIEEKIEKAKREL